MSSSLSNFTVEMKSEDETVCSVSWILLYRASTSGFHADEFHRACDRMGKCVVVVKAENGRIAAAYNEDGFTTVGARLSSNLNGFIVSVAEDGKCGEIFHRNDHEVGIFNHHVCGPDFGGSDMSDLHVSDNCNQNEKSWSLFLIHI